MSQSTVVATTAPTVASTAATSAPATGTAPAVQHGSSVPASQRTPTSYDAGAAQGGGLMQDIGDTISRMTIHAQNKITELTGQMEQMLKSENGEIDQAAFQVYNTKLSQWTLAIEQFAKTKEKEDQAKRAWVQRG